MMRSGFLHEHRISIGRDALFKILGENGLLIQKRRPAKPRTTFSAHYRQYPNIIREGYVPDGANQIWVSDITYVRIGEGFGYLSLITDAYSRKIVGYKLSRTLSASGCAAALRMAFRTNDPDRDHLIHHSDRGMQLQQQVHEAARSDPREHERKE